MTKAPAKSTRNSGNIFEDIGLPNADEHALKADVVIGLAKMIAAKGFSQTKVASITGISQPDISRLLRGHFDGFTMDRLLEAFLAIGSDVEIRVRRPVDDRRGHARVLQIA